MAFTQDSRGVFYGVDWGFEPWAIKVFDAHGRRVKTIGRNGEGPGEFRLARPPLFGRGDTAHVVDMISRRLTRLSPSGVFLGSNRLAAVRDASNFVVLDHGFAVAGTIGTQDRAGWPLRYLSRTAQPVRSFGLDVPVMNPNKRNDFRRVIALAKPDGIWSSFVNRYIIEHWSADGKRLQSLQRRAEWFVEWDSYEGPSTVVPPPATVHTIWEDSGGLLWVAIHLRDANWRRTNLQARPGDMIRVSRSEKNRVFDTLVEVIDPRLRKLVAVKRFDEFMVADAGDQPFISFHEGPDGSPSHRLWRFQLIH